MRTREEGILYKGKFFAMSTVQLHGAIFVGSEIGLAFWTPGLPKLFVIKSTYEKHKEFVSKTAPHLKFVGETGKTKFAVANGRVAHSIAEATIPLRSENRRGEAIFAASKCSVVPNRKMSAPFLLPKAQMKNLEMTLDIAGETATVTIGRNKQEIPIDEMGGHVRMRTFAGGAGGHDVEMQVGSDRLGVWERRVRWMEKGVTDGQLAFLTGAIDCGAERFPGHICRRTRGGVTAGRKRTVT